METDILIVGTGVAGLYAALNLPSDKRILMVTKAGLEESDSFLAQGGMCVLKEPSDYDSYFEDTMRAGHYENNKRSVEIMINSSQSVLKTLIECGAEFKRNSKGELEYTKEGAHSKPRIVYHEDITGREITSKLLARVKTLRNVTFIENFTMVDIIEEDRKCRGIIGINADGKFESVAARFTLLATGGIGGLYNNSTNYAHLTGDALAICKNHGVRLQNLDYVQIHPTTLYSKKKGRRFLISESVRGEGAKLYDMNMNRFVNELLPRDVVANAIKEQMRKDKSPYVWLSMCDLGEKTIKSHFPNIYTKCLEEGYDVTKDCIPVVPSQHYFMGGIWVDENSKTDMENLYAAGETSCNGVHGKNRLASNSLLESMVFAERAAKDMIKNWTDEPIKAEVEIDEGKYENYAEDYAKTIREEMERMRKEHERYNNEIKCG
ncbi:MAG: L-aspartate oxidase [Firmicutes bacterium]|nr:L-aspartate oxidase [Bacillota bacterium]